MKKETNSRQLRDFLNVNSDQFFFKREKREMKSNEDFNEIIIIIWSLQPGIAMNQRELRGPRLWWFL